MFECTPPTADRCAARPGEPCSFESIGAFPDASGKIGAVEVLRCSGCGHGITMPPLADVSFLYADRQTQDFQPDTTRIAAAIKDVAFAMQARKLLQQLDGTPNRVLDFGCGSGQFTRALAKQLPHARVTGSDFHSHPPAMLAGAAYVPIAGLDPVEGAFDLVIAMHVLEHSDDPRELLSRMARLARPGGTLVVEVPHVDCPWNRLLGQKWDPWYVPFHRVHFSRLSLRKCFDDAGLSVVAVHDITVPAMGRSIANLFGRRNGLSWLLAGMALHPVQWLMEKLSGEPSALRVIARA
jgi:2-polyprenyl-3-methyl-5-hydroxy-6-metoxy-1,4-benzoquinol methylase